MWGKAAAGGLGWARLRLADQVLSHLHADKLGSETQGNDLGTLTP